MKKMKRVFIVCAVTLLLVGCGAQQDDQVKYIGANTAKSLALRAAGFTADQVTFSSTDMNTRDGLDYYQVAFRAGEQEYRYNIDALTGVVIDYQEPAKVASGASGTQDTAQTPETPEKTPELDADTDIYDHLLQTVQKDDQNAPVSGQKDNDQNAPVTGQENTAQNTPATGQGNTAQNAPATGQGNTAQNTPATGQSGSGKNDKSDIISKEAAKAAALAHAGLTADQVVFMKDGLDWDDGRRTYELEFYTADYTEYDYEIDAYTGAVLDFDYDAEYYTPPVSGGNGSHITADEAKAKALMQVPGATLDDIWEFETDYDDGRLEYEGKIYYDHMEYEFEIDGYSGAIRSWEVESIYD